MTERARRKPRSFRLVVQSFNVVQRFNARPPVGSALPGLWSGRSPAMTLPGRRTVRRPPMAMKNPAGGPPAALAAD